MKKIIENLLKVKSIVTFVACGILVYCVVKGSLEEATVTAILMMVFQNLFDKDKKIEKESEK